MEKIKRISTFLLFCILLAGCGKENKTISKYDSELDYNIDYSDRVYEYNGIAYISGDDNQLYFMDLSNGKLHPLCMDVNCKHYSNDCSAYFANGLGLYMSVQDEKLYVDAYDEDYNLVIYRMNLDGTEREAVFKMSSLIQEIGMSSYQYGTMISDGHIYIDFEGTYENGSQYKAFYHCDIFDKTYEQILEGDETNNKVMKGTSCGKIYVATRQLDGKTTDTMCYNPETKKWTDYDDWYVIYDNGQMQYVSGDSCTYKRDGSTGKIEKFCDGNIHFFTSKYGIVSHSDGTYVSSAQSEKEEGFYIYDLNGKEVMFIEATQELKTDSYGFGIIDVTSSAIWVGLYSKNNPYGYILFDEIEAGNPEIHVIQYD